MNKKLLAKEEIIKFLADTFAEKTDNPYNDRTEAESKINAASEGITYDFEDENPSMNQKKFQQQMTHFQLCLNLTEIC